jgi:hypothetical protein
MTVGGYNSGMVLEFRRAVLPEEALALWKLDVEIFRKDAFQPEDWLTLESYGVVVDGRWLDARRLFIMRSFKRIFERMAETLPSRVRLYSEYGAAACLSGAGAGKSD